MAIILGLGGYPNSGQAPNSKPWQIMAWLPLSSAILLPFMASREAIETVVKDPSLDVFAVVPPAVIWVEDVLLSHFDG